MALVQSRIFYGYRIVAAAFALQLFGWGVWNSFGVFFTPLMEAFALRRAALSGITSLGIIICGAAGILQGRLNDRYGPRVIMTVNGVLTGAGLCLMSQAQALWHMYLFFSLLVGVGLGGNDVVLLSTIARWFIRLRGLMSGIIKVGTGAGMLLMPFLINGLIRSYGWRTAFFVLGVMVLLVFLLLSRLLVRDPEKKGLAPDNAQRPIRSSEQGPETGLPLQKVLATIQFWGICGAYFIVLFCTATILVHIVPHAIDLGMTSTEAAAVLSTIGGVSIAGRFFVGAAIDRIGSRRALLICFSVLTLGTVWLQFSATLWMLLVFAVLNGFAHGGFYALTSPLLAEFFGTVSLGAIFGVLAFTYFIGGALGPVAAGVVFDATGTYRIVFITLIFLSLAGTAVAWMLKNPPSADQGG